MLSPPRRMRRGPDRRPGAGVMPAARTGYRARLGPGLAGCGGWLISRRMYQAPTPNTAK